jgi:glucosamine--fructose-6-phosphate aminotransferase (isomerizing)
MCGIVGYIGKREAYPILIKGLKRLEYRGYDSAGVAMINGQNADEKKWNELYQKIENNPEERFHSGCVIATGHESKEVLKKAISEDYKLLGM